MLLDFFALYKTNDKKIEKKYQKIYKNNVSEKVMTDVRKLMGEIVKYGK